ncbi:transcription factor MYB41-like protein [Tanacetum coccineum]
MQFSATGGLQIAVSTTKEETDKRIKNFWSSKLRKRLMSMGLDQQTHQLSCLEGSAKGLPASSSTSHMAQWESARLEAEAQLSMDSSALLPLPSPNKTTHPNNTTYPDYILRIWHSEVGESFRNRKPVCFGPASQASVSETTSEMAPTTEPELDTELSCAQGAMNVQLFYTALNKAQVKWRISSDTELHPLLLEFRFSMGPDDMSFLELRWIDWVDPTICARAVQRLLSARNRHRSRINK